MPVAYECFKFQRGRRPVMGIAGLTSAILRYGGVSFFWMTLTGEMCVSSMKLYDRHRTLLMKAASN